MAQCTLLLSIAPMGAPIAAFAATIATPDPAMVARYRGDAEAMNAKLAECKTNKDLASVLADVACMSAEEANKVAERKNLALECSAADTFVDVQGTMTRKAHEAYLVKHAPSDAVLENCKLTKETCLSNSMKRAPK